MIYQIYLRSFADENGDGIGDIAGIRSRLSYLKALGVDGLWVNPWYPSPMHDAGYDVADYRAIAPEFGTLEAAEALIAEARQLGLRVLVDLVPNHTSIEHPWFQAARKAPPGSAERGRYHFRPGRGDGPPSDWKSVFGGPAWTQLPDGEWYLHLFDVSQPDLNWAHPEVRSEFQDILRFWLERGAAGFRVDVAHALAKDPAYPDQGEGPAYMPQCSHLGFESGIDAANNHPFKGRDEIHEIVRGWRRLLDEHGEQQGEDHMMVAEAWIDWSRLKRFLRPGEYHQVFDPGLLTADWDRDAMRQAIALALKSAGEPGSLPTWVLSNHDIVRHTTRYGLPKGIDSKDWLLSGDRALLDPEQGLRRALAATLMQLALPGSVYLYQGEELGLPEVHDLPIDRLQDPIWERSRHTQKGRDGCRVPIPWTRDGVSFGFGSAEPWLPQPASWAALSVEAQEGAEGSTLELYRSAIRLRSAFRYERDFTLLDTAPPLLAFQRGASMRCVVNFGPQSLPLPEGEILLSSQPISKGALPPDTTVWLG